MSFASIITFKNVAQISYDLQVSNKGPFTQLQSGSSEITGINISVTLSSKTFAPGINITGVNGNIGFKKWTPTGFRMTTVSPPFSAVSPTLSDSRSHASSETSLSIEINDYKIMSRVFSETPTFDLSIDSNVNYKNLQNDKKSFINISTTIKQ